jgi:hypothetical protein
MALDPLQQVRTQQRKLVLQNLLKVLDHAGDSARRSQEAIELMAVQIRALIRTLPEEGLLRETAWRRLQPEVSRALERMSLAVGRDLVLEAAAMVPEQAEWAANYLRSGLPGDAPGAAAARRALTGENNPFDPRTVEGFPGATYTAQDLGNVGANPEILGTLQQRVPPQVMAQVKAMRIDGRTLQQWFGDSVVIEPGAASTIGGVATDARGLPRFAKFGMRSIDRNVRAGFISQLTNEQIAQNIIADEIRGNMRLGQGVVRLKSDARAITRTALANLSEKVHQDQWRGAFDTDYSFVDDNGVRRYPGREMQNGMKWRWDASNDSRTCPECSSLDNKTVDTREELPSIPLHIQCRCQALPVSLTQQALERRERSQDKKAYGVEVTNRPPPPQRDKEPRKAYVDRMHREGWFLTQGRSKSGERFWRRRVEVSSQDGTVADFLGGLVQRAAKGTDVTGAATTLQEYFNGGRAGAKRALVFARLVNGGMDPQDALQQLFRHTGNSALRTYVPAADLAGKYPQWEEALDRVQPRLSPRQRRRRAKGLPLGQPRRGY